MASNQYVVEQAIPAKGVREIWAFTIGEAFTRFSEKFNSDLTMVYADEGDRLTMDFAILGRNGQTGNQSIEVTGDDMTMVEFAWDKYFHNAVWNYRK